MRRTFLLFIAFSYSLISLGQENECKKIKELFKENDIKLNSPLIPPGYHKYVDCDGRIVFKNTSEDTIRFYKWRSVIAEDLETFLKSMKSEKFNTTRYPTEIQKNGTVLMVNLGLNEFIFRNDTLYLLDQYDKDLADKNNATLELMLNGEITIEEYEKRIQNFKIEDSIYLPKYKVIFYKGIFDQSNVVYLPANLNFRNEKVELKSTWIQDGIKCYDIKLQTNDAGEYIFNEDMKFLGLENCELVR